MSASDAVQPPTSNTPSVPIAAPTPASAAAIADSVPSLPSVEHVSEALLNPMPDWAFRTLKGVAFLSGVALGVFTGLDITSGLTCTVGFAIAGTTLGAVVVISYKKGDTSVALKMLLTATGGWGLGVGGTALAAGLIAAPTAGKTFVAPLFAISFGAIFSIFSYRTKSPKEESDEFFEEMDGATEPSFDQPPQIHPLLSEHGEHGYNPLLHDDIRPKQE